MKILAVRGKNLASLVGSFAVDLDRAPLDRAGLFAITGPTAAGKSTLLDAICLALFDEVPRLRAAPKHHVGREGDAVLADDVRSLLSRGTAAGHAEVEFLGRDGERYVARWEVWRAHSKADGALQKQVLSLKDASGLALGGSTKTETLAAIRAKLGLTFEQFCRSALLAQGDFAAFLRASPDERAALLEQMTGTELYSKLSQGAHERAAVERKALEDLALKQGTVQVLADDVRARVHAERDAEASRVAAAEAARAAAAAALNWHMIHAEREGLVQQAREDLGYAEATRAAAAGDRRELALVEAAQALRPLLEAQMTSLRAANDAAATLMAAQGRHEQAERDVAKARASEDVARISAAAAEDTRTAAKPRLAEARALEHELASIGRDLTQARSQASAAEAETASARAHVAQKEQEQRGAEAARRDAMAWLAAHAQDEALAREWSRWRAELERAEQAHGQLVAADGKRPALERAATDAERKREAATSAAASATTAVEQREAEVHTARTAADEARAKAPRGGRAGMVEERTRLLELERTSVQATAAREAEEGHRRRAAEARGLADQARQQAATARERRAALEVHRADEARHLELARATRDLAAHRTDLVEGQPCPLCGAQEHPYASALPPLDAMLQDLEQRVVSLAADAARALTEQTTAEATREEQARRAAEADASTASAAAERAEHQEGWRELRGQVGGAIPDSPLDGGALASVRTLLADLAIHLSAAEAAEAAVGHFAVQEKGARDRLDQARKALAKAERERSTREAEATTAATAWATAEGERGRFAADEQAALAAVAPAFATETHFVQGLRKDARAFIAACDRRVADRLLREKALTDVERLLARLGPEVATAQERGRDRHASARAAAERRDALAARHVDIASRHGALFDGRSAGQVEREQDAAVASATAVLSAVRAETANAERNEASTAASLATLTEVRDRQGQARDAAAQALDQALTARSWTRVQLAALLQRDPAWLDAQRTRLADLDRAETQARSVLGEREAQLATHLRTDPPTLAQSEAEAALFAAATAMAEAEAALQKQEFALEKDDDARARKGQLEAEAGDRLKSADVWLRLGDLMGSKDGKKLRVFAQGLTFEALLAHANEHLKLLRPRYRLARVTGDDLNFQVLDLEQGEDVRSVNGLSGGETFLVSLALALGLSSLSSKDTRVESLFIDEGFGTLDPESLDEALDALDALQGSGRKVGVISHVPGLAEHIGVQVKVLKLGNGRSRVEVAGAPKPKEATVPQEPQAAAPKRRTRVKRPPIP